MPLAGPLGGWVRHVSLQPPTPPPPTDPEVYFLKYINKVVSAKVYVSSLKLKDFAKYPRIESDMSNLGRPMN